MSILLEVFDFQKMCGYRVWMTDRGSTIARSSIGLASTSRCPYESYQEKIFGLVNIELLVNHHFLSGIE